MGLEHLGRRRLRLLGDAVREGDILLTLHTDTPDRFERALAALDGGIEIAPEGTALDRTPIVIDRIA